MLKSNNYLIYLCSLFLFFSAPLLADDMGTQGKSGVSAAATTEDQSDELQNAQETVQDAAKVVQQIRMDPQSRNLLDQSKAVFIVPDYGRAALGVGGAGGQGVLVSNNDANWSGPAFYNIGAINFGVSAGAEAGSIAFFIMSDQALQGFKDDNNFSLNADAGLTIVEYSKRAQASFGKGADVIVWSDTEGLFGDLSISVTDIFRDDEANAAYYGRTARATEIIDGKVQASESSSENPLRSEFSALEEAEGNKEAPAKQPDTTSGKDY